MKDKKETEKVPAMPEKQPDEKSAKERSASRIEQLADELASLAERTHPFFNLLKKVVISEESFYNILNELVESQPEELVEAQKILARREDIIRNAHDEAQKVIDVAQKRLEELTSEQEVVKQAHREAERIMRDAVVRADQTRLEALQYIYQKMDELERNFNSSLTTIRNSKIVIERELSQNPRDEDYAASESQ